MCLVVFGHFGSSVSANSIFSVLAGASRQCALCAASTSPDSASATIHERAVRSFGSTGAPPARSTCVPGFPSRAPPTVDIDAGGVADGLAEELADGLGAASAAGVRRASAARAAEVTVRDRLTASRVRARARTYLPGATPSHPPDPAHGSGHRAAILKP